MKRSILLCALLLVVSFAAAVPAQINYQGKITNSAGVALEGTYDMTFRLYNVPTGGTALWSETHSSVGVHKGLFDVILGETNPINLPFDEQYYLEIEVEGEVVGPRIPLSSVGYAFRSARADTVNWSGIQGIPSGFSDGVDDVDDADNVVGNEYNTGLSFDDGTNTLSLTDGGGTLTTTIDNEADDLSDNFLGDLGDVNTSGAVAGQVLAFNGTNWVPEDVSGTDNYVNGVNFNDASNTLTLTRTGGLSDLTTAINNEADDLSDNSINDLSDVSVSSPASGQVLKWNGSAWVNSADNIGTDDQTLSWSGSGPYLIDIEGTSNDAGVRAGTGISLSLTGDTLVITNTGDLSNTNELQTLSLSGNQLTISSGNTVAFSGWDTNASDDATGSGTSDYVAKWTGSSSLGNSQIYDNGGNVGIGTTSPSYKLHVVSSGTAIYGQSTASSDYYGVYGSCNNADYYGYGGYFVGGWRGVYGKVLPNGSNIYTGVYGYVSGGSGTNYGVYGYAYDGNTNYGVYGYASGGTGDNNFGVYGYSSNGYGVKGSTDNTDRYGVKGENNATSGLARGVYASTASPTGVAVLGLGNGTDTYTYPTGGAGGVFNGYQNSSSQDAIGVYGYANNENSSGRSGGGYFEGHLAGDYTYAWVGLYASGTKYKVTGDGTVSTIVRDTNGKRVALFCPEAPEVLFQDFGIGQLKEGKAHIELDQTFAKNVVVDENHPMRVFVQVYDDEDCKGVVVKNRTPNGFDVVEIGGGKSNAKFAWFVICNRADEINEQGQVVSKYQDLRFPAAVLPSPTSTRKTDEEQFHIPPLNLPESKQ